MVETGLNGLRKLHTIKIMSICHELLGKSGIKGNLGVVIPYPSREYFITGRANRRLLCFASSVRRVL
jgi:hypothetical protein